MYPGKANIKNIVTIITGLWFLSKNVLLVLSWIEPKSECFSRVGNTSPSFGNYDCSSDALLSADEAGIGIWKWLSITLEGQKVIDVIKDSGEVTTLLLLVTNGIHAARQRPRGYQLLEMAQIPRGRVVGGRRHGWRFSGVLADYKQHQTNIAVDQSL